MMFLSVWFLIGLVVAVIQIYVYIYLISVA